LTVPEYTPETAPHPLKDADYQLFLVKRFSIAKNETLNVFEIDGKVYSDLSQALLEADGRFRERIPPSSPQVQDAANQVTKAHQSSWLDNSAGGCAALVMTVVVVLFLALGPSFQKAGNTGGNKARASTQRTSSPLPAPPSSPRNFVNPQGLTPMTLAEFVSQTPNNRDDEALDK
jgi:hypothetical protein